MSQTFYAVKRERHAGDGHYFGTILTHAKGIRFTHPNDRVWEVTFREVRDGEDPQYWGWEAADKDGEWSMIWASLSQLQVCFTYGLEKMEEIGRGRRVLLVVEKERLLGENEE
jgi:hypothetical protein